jgi:hypothetical protein
VDTVAALNAGRELATRITDAAECFAEAVSYAARIGGEMTYNGRPVTPTWKEAQISLRTYDAGTKDSPEPRWTYVLGAVVAGIVYEKGLQLAASGGEFTAEQISWEYLRLLMLGNPPEWVERHVLGSLENRENVHHVESSSIGERPTPAAYTFVPARPTWGDHFRLGLQKYRFLIWNAARGFLFPRDVLPDRITLNFLERVASSSGRPGVSWVQMEEGTPGKLYRGFRHVAPETLLSYLQAGAIPPAGGLAASEDARTALVEILARVAPAQLTTESLRQKTLDELIDLFSREFLIPKTGYDFWSYHKGGRSDALFFDFIASAIPLGDDERVEMREWLKAVVGSVQSSSRSPRIAKGFSEGMEYIPDTAGVTVEIDAGKIRGQQLKDLRMVESGGEEEVSIVGDIPLSAVSRLWYNGQLIFNASARKSPIIQDWTAAMAETGLDLSAHDQQTYAADARAALKDLLLAGEVKPLDWDGARPRAAQAAGSQWMRRMHGNRVNGNTQFIFEIDPKRFDDNPAEKDVLIGQLRFLAQQATGQTPTERSYVALVTGPNTDLSWLMEAVPDLAKLLSAGDGRFVTALKVNGRISLKDVISGHDRALTSIIAFIASENSLDTGGIAERLKNSLVALELGKLTHAIQLFIEQNRFFLTQA